MRLDDQEESSNIEDRRGQRQSGFGLGGGRGRIGIGTIVLALAASYFFGIDPMAVIDVASNFQGEPSVQTQEQTSAHNSPANDSEARFVSKILASTETTWEQIFREHGQNYAEPRLVLFSGATQSACGLGQAAMGPFYCPSDQRVYIDLSFFRDLQQRFRAPGEFAQAYVIAHEIGHHVQNLLGISDQVHRAQQSASRAKANALSVRLELQADCFAGVWGYRADAAKNIIEPGEIEQALNAAAQIGDDRLQQQTQGRVVPESFTHGSSEQRVRWLTKGFQSGNPDACDTFSVPAASL